MKIFRRFNKFYRDKDGWTKVKRSEVEYLHSRIYLDYRELSDLYDAASDRNFKTELDDASHGLFTVLMCRNGYQLEWGERGEGDVVLTAKMFLVCRFVNSTYACLRLACMGLVLDATACLKTAFEALQFIRLISLDETFASSFMDSDKSLRPVEVRRHLQRMGHDVEGTQKKYAMLSKFSHLGGTGETLTLEDIGGSAAFVTGGSIDPHLQRSIIRDCHRACGEFIAYSIGIRAENVEKYHGTIKRWIAEGLSSQEILQRTERLIVELR
jgi:hypothetical protein